ncbi:DNA polymerase I [Candidatus Cyrtobacter comes]|uniref:DNA-directed DNA polymerase n=1 Tax=Candidatus Cyrtobacter comes TaxID=675776 RepID=A0ABU5L6J1_9RICK|nr:DNA polymerase I [Candidatus Cyrtobacter comes]MDZ5761747.1 DNA polymerase I [Candidatus Cyrtobacter comes]
MKICIIDGYGIVFRAYFSIPYLSCPAGQNVSALYGFCNVILKIMEKKEFDLIVIALDSGKKTFRNEILDTYKANRVEAPEDLRLQFPLIREAAMALGICAIEKEGFEADDIIATLAKRAEKKGYRTEIITADKDIAQLVNENISVFDPIKESIMSREVIFEKFGVWPENLADFFALVGDASDNIPGVPGIGPKTASKLISEYKQLDLIYEKSDLIQPLRIQKILKENRESAYLSRKLVTLIEDVPLEVELSDLTIKRDDMLLDGFLKKYGFQSIARRLGVDYTRCPASEKKLKKAEIDGSFFNDLELDGTAYIHMDENGLYIASEKYEALYENGNLFSFLGVIKEVLEADYIKKILIDAKCLIKECIEAKIDVKAVESIDIMEYLSSQTKKEYSLQSLCENYGIDPSIQIGVRIGMLYQMVFKNLFSKKSIYIYQHIEKPLIFTLCRMEKLGICVDKEYLSHLSESFSSSISKLEARIYDIAGQKFNIGSPKQLGQVLFEKLFVDKGKKSKKSGDYSTDHEALEKLSQNGHEIADLLLEWRQLTKLLNTYTQGLQKNINNDRIHTTFEMKATSTGRLSSKNPNLQNIPIRTPEGSKIREAFIASDGGNLISADYSQIELRILAHMADIKSLKEAFLSNADIHTKTASELFGMPESKVSKELRRKAKAINFGIIYGITAFGLAKNAQISESEASSYIKEYFKMYPGIKEYMDRIVQEAVDNNFVKSLFGRKCFIANIHSSNFIARSAAQRAAINAPIQSTAADIIKIAMLKMPNPINEFMCLQIHDELLFDIPKEVCKEYSYIIKSVMENAVKISVPLNVDIRISTSWGDS